MIDPTCDSCQRTKLSQSFNPCTYQGRSICSCDCHKLKDDITIQPPPINEIVERLKVFDGRVHELYDPFGGETGITTDDLKSLVAQLTASKEREHRLVAALERIANSRKLESYYVACDIAVEALKENRK